MTGTIEDFKKQINSKFGEQSIQSASRVPMFKYLSTGIFLLDYALLGGIAEAQYALFKGNESSGKSTACLRVVASALNKYPNSKAIYVDTENSFSPVWAVQNGVDIDRLDVISGVEGEGLVDIAHGVTELDEYCILVIDSIANMVTKVEGEKSAYDDTVAQRAKVLNKFYNGTTPNMARRRKTEIPLTIIQTNQYRTNIGQMFGDNRTNPGGNAQKYNSNTIIEFSGTKTKKNEKDERGVEFIEFTEHGFKLDKTREVKPFMTGEYTMTANTLNPKLALGSIRDHLDAVRVAKKHGLLTGGQVVGMGVKFKRQEELVDYFIANPDAYIDFKSMIIAARRVETNLPALPPDNYLYKYHDDDSLAARIAEIVA